MYRTLGWFWRPRLRRLLDGRCVGCPSVTRHYEASIKSSSRVAAASAAEPSWESVLWGKAQVRKVHLEQGDLILQVLDIAHEPKVIGAVGIPLAAHRGPQLPRP